MGQPSRAPTLSTHRRIALAKCNMRILAQMQNEFLPTYTLSAEALLHLAPSGLAYHLSGVSLRQIDIGQSDSSGSMSNGDSSAVLLVGNIQTITALNKHSLVPSADRVLLQSFPAVPPRLNYSSAADKTDTPIVMRERGREGTQSLVVSKGPSLPLHVSFFAPCHSNACIA